MESLISQHGPSGALTAIFLLTGNLINLKANNSTASPLWCNSTNVSTKQLPKGLEEIILLISILIPIVPLSLNKPDAVNIEMFKTHILGQSSSFGLSETLRHFVEMPEPLFLSKCNISIQECKSKTFFSPNLSLLSDSKSNSLCNKNFTETNLNELFNSVHNFPNHTCVMLGSSIVTLVYILIIWQRLNNKDQSPYQTSSIVKVMFITAMCVILSIVLFYGYNLYKLEDKMQIISFLYGVVLQYCINLSMMKS